MRFRFAPLFGALFLGAACTSVTTVEQPEVPPTDMSGFEESGQSVLISCTPNNALMFETYEHIHPDNTIGFGMIFHLNLQPVAELYSPNIDASEETLGGTFYILPDITLPKGVAENPELNPGQVLDSLVAESLGISEFEAALLLQNCFAKSIELMRGYGTPPLPEILPMEG